MEKILSTITVKEIIKEGEVKETIYDNKNRIVSMIRGEIKKEYSYNDNLKIEKNYHNNELQYISVYEKDVILYSHNVKENLMIQYTYNNDYKLILKEVKDLLTSDIICKVVYKYNKEGNLKGERLFKHGHLYSDFVYSYTESLIIIKKYYNKQHYYIIDIIDRISGIIIDTNIVEYSYVR